jgi:hypothetical protein
VQEESGEGREEEEEEEEEREKKECLPHLQVDLNLFPMVRRCP